MAKKCAEQVIISSKGSLCVFLLAQAQGETYILRRYKEMRKRLPKSL
jgi:hypothetical protein